MFWYICTSYQNIIQHYIDSTIPLLLNPKFQAFSRLQSGFLAMRLILKSFKDVPARGAPIKVAIPQASMNSPIDSVITSMLNKSPATNVDNAT